MLYTIMHLVLEAGERPFKIVLFAAFIKADMLGMRRRRRRRGRAKEASEIRVVRRTRMCWCGGDFHSGGELRKNRVEIRRLGGASQALQIGTIGQPADLRNLLTSGARARRRGGGRGALVQIRYLVLHGVIPPNQLVVLFCF
jgi:hypothetical protein